MNYIFNLPDAESLEFGEKFSVDENLSTRIAGMDRMTHLEKLTVDIKPADQNVQLEPIFLAAPNLKSASFLLPIYWNPQEQQVFFDKQRIPNDWTKTLNGQRIEFRKIETQSESIQSETMLWERKMFVVDATYSS